MADIATMKKNIAGLLDIPVIDDTSTPNAEQVILWLDDAAMNMTRLLPIELLATMTDDVFKSGVGARWSFNQYAANNVKLASVVKNNVLCEIIEHKKLLSLKSRAPLLYTSDRPACALTGDNGGEMILAFYPTDVGDITVTYVHAPETSSNWSNSTGSNYEPPGTWNDLLVAYAVAKAKFQDEESEQFQLAYQEWVQGIQGFIQGKALGTESLT